MAKTKARIEQENREFKIADGRIKCLSCNKPAAVVTETGLKCRGCGYEWTYETEAKSVGYITTVLRRPVITPPVVTVAVVEPSPVTFVVESEPTEPAPVKTVKGKG